MTNYDELASRAEAGALGYKPSTVQRGSAAAKAAKNALMEAAGADTLEAAVKIARGRPRLDAAAAAEVTWKVRTTALLDHEAREAAAAHGISMSQLVRDAVLSYVRTLDSEAAPQNHR
jgi:IS5 family transposase